uniref:WAP domain-containing protein n=1 Tax=Megaselia scalaris TaxID=36166 RepID=T1H3T2_MEGSC
MVKLTVLVAFIVMCGIVAFASECPSYSKHTNCSPKCVNDNECSHLGGKCCPNLCNARSCIQANQLGGGGGDKYGNNNKYNPGGGAGTYCGNTKCNSYEKCDFDKSTKRQKCVRA